MRIPIIINFLFKVMENTFINRYVLNNILLVYFCIFMKKAMKLVDVYEYLFKKINPLFLVLISLTFFACNNDGSTNTAPIVDNEVVRDDAAIIDLTNEKQVIRGFGASTAFRLDFPLNDSDMDLIFGNNEDQIGLSILRIRLVPDDNPANRQVELDHALGAKARGAIVIASPWSPPVRMKTNDNLVGGELKTESFEDYAIYLNDFANYMASCGAELYALSIQNEPDIEVDYESCDWSSTKLHNFVRDYGNIITSTKVIGPESYNFNHSVTDPILNDEIATANIDIVGGHIYGGGLTDYPLARSKGKEVWMTEHLDTEITWKAVFATAKEIQDCMVIGNFNAYMWWYAKRFYGPLDEDNTISKRGYIMSNFAKFIRPGYNRVEATYKPKSGIYVSSYYDGNKVVVVALNTKKSNVNQQFVIENGAVSFVIPYTTSQSKNLEKGESINVSSIGAFTFSLPSQSITTFVQQ